MKHGFWALGLIIFLSAASAFAEAEEGFVSLFNGKDLTGWTVKGGFATYNVEDGVIIGRCAPGKPGNTFLCTEKEYANFILKLEFRFVVMGNSGVQFRSHARPQKDSERVFGYQCEIADRVAIGQIYDEGRRAWSYSSRYRNLKRPDDWFAADAVRAYKKNEWNAVEIQCIGPSIRTWINGIPCANIIDTATDAGFFGLQVHAGGAGTLEWRNIEVKELPATVWKPLEGSLDVTKDFVVRARLSEEMARKVCSDSVEKFVKKGENSVVVAAIGNRWVELLNDKEGLDLNDAQAVSDLRNSSGLSNTKDVQWEYLEITPELRQQIER